MKTRIGIRREDRNLWEKRAPLIPSHVRELQQNYPLEVWVQPSSIRIFSDDEYRREGATLTDDLSPCQVIVAVKEVPPSNILPEKTYLFFSHTTKGQPQNMAMLRRLADTRCTLIDYERIMDEKGRRLVFFGRQAGQAGMVDTLWALGRKLKKEGFDTPLLRLEQTWRYSSLAEAKEEVRKAGQEVGERGLVPTLAPLVVGFAGYGHTSQGAQEIFGLLPFQEVEPAGLEALLDDKNISGRCFYKVVFREEHMVEPGRKGKPFNLQEYYSQPHLYRSRFADYLPYLSVLVNCIYWEPRYPRFVTLQDLKKLYLANGRARLRVIGDVSCDVGGSVECTVKCTDPDTAVYVYDFKEDRARDDMEGMGPVVLAVYNLPAEISFESSMFFSQILKDFIPFVAQENFKSTFADLTLPPAIKQAVILHRGELSPDYSYLKDFIRR
ncbi:MAG TPA: bifunctional lysine ketoglutarate reductase /saccharopine dehydrogenase family protein [Acidobacteriota bacterium]